MLPEKFVYLDEVDNSILHDMRYASNLNFVGEAIEGYKTNRAVMTIDLAEALSNIQKQISKDGFSLVIYDAYRPIKAVEHFVKWSSSDNVIDVKSIFYPHIDKSRSFELGYVSGKSAHSRGSTVDLTIIEKSSKLMSHSEIIRTTRKLSDGRDILFLDDGTVDMGSHFDLFDEASWHRPSLFTGDYLKRRQYLQNIMISNGFIDYSKEWWHYSLSNEPFPNTRFDFDIA
jgi:D-alanyl-D-alanine dipeptidase